VTTKVTRKLFVMTFLLVFCLPALSSPDRETKDRPKLLVVWTSGEREVALKVVFMYSAYANQNRWWHKVRLLVWGPSAKLLTEDQELQDYVQKMMAAGVEVIACERSANSYRVSEKLKEMGIQVINVEKRFTTMLKSDWKTLTF